MIQENQYGDLNETGDDKTIVRTFSPNTTAWILGLPASEYIHAGIDTSEATKVAGVDYYYDGVTDCATPSTTQTPEKGNITRVVRWLKDGVSPETRFGYDTYGNLACSRDPRGYTSTISYDGSFTFPTVSTNSLGHQTFTWYYGVDNVPTDTGLYGQMRNIQDPNGAVVSYQYDIFGRKIKETMPDNSWTSWAYNSFGTVGSQHIRTDTSEGLWSESYFDGLGRTIREKAKGPDLKNIAAVTEYDARGAVSRKSVPYFDSIETPRYQSFSYDALGRVTQATSPDATRQLACHENGVTVGIDPNNHRKRQTRDVFGRLIKVEEYAGTFTACSPEAGTPYATTLYQYDNLGNLRFVADAKGSQTEMRYDTLGRKTFMRDPDMGDWSYAYDGSGNLISQTDAKLQTVSFAYDALNRPILKNYPTGTDVTYAYDEATFTNGKGRLTKMTDGSGTTSYHYDLLGRTVKTIRNVDGTGYQIEAAYDGLDRIRSVKYPDNETINYVYDGGGNLWRVSDATINYATYTGYSALGQPGTVSFGNGVVTNYQYSATNNRLSTITTNNQAQGLINVSYVYDSKGNITGITDNLNNPVPQTLSCATVNYAPYAGKPHAVGSTSTGKSYIYDANGNMTTDGTRTVAYNYDNMPTAIDTAASFVYDGSGSRVKKITGTGTTVYIDKLYECVSGACGKYIFAGDDRIALKSATQTLYYHPDHLGSSNVVTDAAGNKVEDIAYYPFGETRSDTGTAGVNHKYTGQERDYETGLYNYNARLYDPEIGRFISADTLVPDPENPQSLNRYSYVQNNPLYYTDPTGHDFWKKVWNWIQENILEGSSVSRDSNGNWSISNENGRRDEADRSRGGGGSGRGGGGNNGSNGNADAVLILHQYYFSYSNIDFNANSPRAIFADSGVGRYVFGSGLDGRERSVSLTTLNDDKYIPTNPADCHMGNRSGLNYTAPEFPIAFGFTVTPPISNKLPYWGMNSYSFNSSGEGIQRSISPEFAGASFNFTLGKQGTVEIGRGIGRHMGLGVNIDHNKSNAFTGLTVNIGVQWPPTYSYGSVTVKDNIFKK